MGGGFRSRKKENPALFIPGGWNWLICRKVSDELDASTKEWTIISWVKITAYKSYTIIFSSALDGYGHEYYLELNPGIFHFIKEEAFSNSYNSNVDHTKWNLFEINFKNGRFSYFINGKLIGYRDTGWQSARLFNKSDPTRFEIFNYYGARGRNDNGPEGYIYKFQIWDKVYHTKNYNPISAYSAGNNFLYNNIKIS